jgi:transposase
MSMVTTMVVRIGREERGALEAVLHRTDLKPRVRERVEMVKAAALGQDLRSICAWSGRTAETVRYWLGRYVTAGLSGLADAPRSGRPARADAAYHAALAAALDTSPRAAGCLFDVWTSARLSAYLTEQTGVRIAPSWLRTLVQQHDYVCGRPKHSLRHLRDADELAACIVELAAVEKKGGGGAGPV